MRIMTVLALVAGAVALAGCGSSDPGGGGSTGSQGDSANSSKAFQFAQCMRSHGVPNFPDPTGGQLNLRVQQSQNGTAVNGVQVNGPAFRSAMNACRSYLPNGGHPTAAQTARAHAAALQFSRCMRAHGLPNFPDPQFSGGKVSMQIGSGTGLDPNSPAFKAAQRACQPLIGKGLSTTSKGP